MDYDHILFVGFGGPTKTNEIEPFLRQVAMGRNIPEARLKEVLHHYELVGGYSPYNECCFRIIESLRVLLAQNSQLANIPVFIGMRNWHPFLNDVMKEIKKRDLKKGIAVVLAPHRAEASFERYQENVIEAQKQAAAEAIQYDYTPSWYDLPLFLEAQAEEIQGVCAGKLEGKYLLFCAHSIPLEMAGCSSYVQEYETSCSLVAKLLKKTDWGICYQSRSGPPHQKWLEPDILESLKKMKEKGAVSDVLVAPIGFFCDNVEVLFDLDYEAKAEAQKLGLHFLRAKTVNDHPKFIKMFYDLIVNKFNPLIYS